MSRTFLSLAAIIAFASNAAAKPTVKPAPPPPPFAGAYQPQGVDEAGMWREADESERNLATSSLIIADPALNAYVRNVLCSAVGDDRCKAARVYIVRVPFFNASMSPNGTMQVYSGLLLRLRTEAELASILAHEFGHFEKRHSLSSFKAMRRGTDFLSWAAVLASMSGTRQGWQSFEQTQISVLGGLRRFDRNMEREADILSIGYLNASTMRPQAASRVWRDLIRESEASAAAKGLSKPNANAVPFLSTHPASGERADYLYALAAPDHAQRDEGAGRYQAAIAPWLGRFLDDQIALNDFGATEFIINRIAETGWTADLWRARGDLYRTRGYQRDLMNAAEFYGKAVALAPDLAQAQRGLGLSLIKTGRVSEGRSSLERYLALVPTATDAAMIKMTLTTTGGTP